MSFELGFYKDILYNKLGAAKDRAAAALKQLDNCDIRLKIITTSSRENTNKMPIVRSKSKCKHSYSHEEERLHKPTYHDDWSSDEGYDSDCSCSDRTTVGRGRGSHRDADVYIDGGNASQQNIQVQGCCGGKCKHVHRRRPRSRSVIVVKRPRCRHQYGCGRKACHPDGHCCIHGMGSHDFCSRCPAGQRMWDLPNQMPSARQNHFRVITDDDGKMNVYDRTKLSKFLYDQAQAYAKSEADKKAANDKTLADAMGVVNKMCRPSFMGGSCGCGGNIHNCGIYQGSRSAQAIEHELAQVNADLDQLHAKALLDAQMRARANLVGAEELAMCSGALQDDTTSCGRRSGNLEQKMIERPLNSVLAGPGLNKGGFANVDDYRTARRKEELGEEDNINSIGKLVRCCSGCG